MKTAHLSGGTKKAPQLSAEELLILKSLLAKLEVSALEWARTINLRFRRPMLYPIELRVLVRHVPRERRASGGRLKLMHGDVALCIGLWRRRSLALGD